MTASARTQTSLRVVHRLEMLENKASQDNISKYNDPRPQDSVEKSVKVNGDVAGTDPC
jgi:hypothetical protein